MRLKIFRDCILPYNRNKHCLRFRRKTKERYINIPPGFVGLNGQEIPGAPRSTFQLAENHNYWNYLKNMFKLKFSGNSFQEINQILLLVANYKHCQRKPSRNRASAWSHTVRQWQHDRSQFWTPPMPAHMYENGSAAMLATIVWQVWHQRLISGSMHHTYLCQVWIRLPLYSGFETQSRCY